MNGIEVKTDTLILLSYCCIAFPVARLLKREVWQHVATDSYQSCCGPHNVRSI